MNLENAKKIKNKIRKGQLSIGTWMQISSSAIGEILARSGYDWVAIDMEHGAFAFSELPDIFRAIELGGSQPFVRLATGLRKDIKSVLDSGATGIIIPMIESGDQARSIISEMYYPPRGVRGVGFSRANAYGRYFNDYHSEINESLTIVAQIEHIDAIQNLDDILKIDEIDALMIGPYDLSASMGIAGQFNHPDFISVLNEFKGKCKKLNKTIGFHVVKPEVGQLREKIMEEYKFIAYSLDGAFLNYSADYKTELGEF